MGVNCGGHYSPTCAECPQGHGEVWCNGECIWSIDRCVARWAHGEEVFPECFNIPRDTRASGCPRKPDAVAPDVSVSIIIPWHQEKWLHLRDTLQSLLYYTPDDLVEEYIFVSDGNSNSREPDLAAMSPK